MVRDLLALRTAVCSFAVVLALLLTGPVTPAAAQILYGSVVGNVTDESGASVPGAEVTITNKQTGASRTAVTNENGGYNIPTVQNGEYTLRVAREGFRAATNENVLVPVNNVVRADFRLTLGQVTETVNVESSALALQTDRAEVKAEIGSKQLTEIPVPGQRNYQALFVTIPGISPPTTPHSVPSNPSRSMQWTTNGNNTAANNTRIDGASATNIWLPHIASYVPALESIETVNVVTNSFDAEQGLAGGASVNVIVRSGTNETRGALFHYHQGNWSQSRNFFLPPDRNNPKFVYNQFGGRLGGAIVKNKAFYFVSYEGTTDYRFAAALRAVPTAPTRAGNLSISTLGIYDPMTGEANGTGRLPFAGNIIPSARIHPTSTRLMNLLPQENQPQASGLPTNNYFASGTAFNRRHTIDSKFNFNISDKTTAYVRLSALDFTMLDPASFGPAQGQPIAFGNPGNGFGQTWSSTVAATHTLTPNFILDAYFGYTLMDANVEQPGLGPNTGRDELGIPGTNGTRYFESGLPGFGIGGFAAFGSTENYMPYFRNDPQFQYVANANWLKGSHNVRFGFDIYHLQLNHTQPEFAGAAGGAAGRLNFNQGPTQLRLPNGNVQGGNQFNSMATFLLGLVDGGGRILQVPDVYRTKTTMWSFYVRDQWQATRNLTVSLGTRLELFPMPYREGDRGMERYDFNTNEMIICGVGGNPKDCGTSVGGPFFSPRLGIAYRLGDKTVIRSGFGINWDPWNLARPLRTNYPILAAFNLAPPALGWATTLSQGLPALPEPQIGQNGRIAMPTNYAANTTGDEFKRSYILNYNLMVQRELGGGFIGQAGYVASRAVGVSGRFNLNAGQVIGADQAGQPLFARFGRAVETAMVMPMGNTDYHSLQMTLSRRFSNGFQMNTAYTWSKAMGWCCNEDNNGGPLVPALDYLDLNRVPLGFDRTHNLQITATYELPFGNGKRLATSGVGAAILGGWQLNTLTSFMTGTPVRVTSDGGSLRLPGSTQRADQVKQNVQTLGNIGVGQAYYDPFAFERVLEPRFGTAGFNSLRGPEFFNSDLGLFRTFAFKERFSMQFRAEYFNWTNTPKFNNPSSGINNRLVFPDGSFRGGVFEVTGTNSGGREPNGDRILRLGLRLTF
ncbi:MAG: carboxypeptidase regulatory-like domain-containing protein [Bryobacterales bacterium]|nr:carboxypeptidase regulatory-like domain-containing protein [Bryobacterales bacterium]